MLWKCAIGCPPRANDCFQVITISLCYIYKCLLVVCHGGSNRFKFSTCDVTHKLIFNVNKKITAENVRKWTCT